MQTSGFLTILLPVQGNDTNGGGYVLIPVAESKVLVKRIDVLHISLAKLEVENIDVFLYSGLGDGLRNCCNTSLHL
jgi:hypothetical protein